MQRLATAQGKTISTQQRLADEKARLEKAKKELADVEQQQKELKKSEKTDKLVQALEKGDDAVVGPALWACLRPRIHANLQRIQQTVQC